jgi:hypothetical protein
VQVLVTCAAPVDDAIRAQLTDAAGVPPARFMPETSLLFFLHDETAVERLGAVEGVVRSQPRTDCRLCCHIRWSPLGTAVLMTSSQVGLGWGRLGGAQSHWSWVLIICWPALAVCTQVDDSGG